MARNTRQFDWDRYQKRLTRQRERQRIGQVCLLLPVETREELTRRKKVTGRTVSEQIREAIRRYLND